LSRVQGQSQSGTPDTPDRIDNKAGSPPLAEKRLFVTPREAIGYSLDIQGTVYSSHSETKASQPFLREKLADGYLFSILSPEIPCPQKFLPEVPQGWRGSG